MCETSIAATASRRGGLWTLGAILSAIGAGNGFIDSRARPLPRGKPPIRHFPSQAPAVTGRVTATRGLSWARRTSDLPCSSRQHLSSARSCRRLQLQSRLARQRHRNQNRRRCTRRSRKRRLNRPRRQPRRGISRLARRRRLRSHNNRRSGHPADHSRGNDLFAASSFPKPHGAGSLDLPRSPF